MREMMLFWLTTIITSYGIQIANGLMVFKDAADVGYKIDAKKIKKYKNNYFQI